MWETFSNIFALLPKAVEIIKISKPWVHKDKRRFMSPAPDINKAMSYLLVFDSGAALEMPAEEWMNALRLFTSLFAALEKLHIPVRRSLADSDDIPIEREIDALHDCLAKIYVLALDGNLEDARKLKITPLQP